ncbi:response regulator transcription factor [Salininema proteolyticum]|uniref:Response regulator transcription factor n=1 Tax=Salininema proteolyticum TaxID=1607685 RepID=A0ABV8TXV0_9ACTN
MTPLTTVPTVSEPSAGLSPTQTDIVRLLAAGRSHQAIARECFISIRTLERNVASIKAKLNASNLVQLGMAAERHGLLWDRRARS